MTPEEKQALFAKAQAERDAWEVKNCGGYEKIYPFDVRDQRNYYLTILVANFTRKKGKKYFKNNEAQI